MATNPCIWLTRPEPDNDALAATLRAAGIQAIASPILEIKSIEFKFIKQHPAVEHKAVLITSRHAVHALDALPDRYHALPMFCVGEATANAIRGRGFHATIVSEPEVLALLPRIAETLPPDASLLYLSGEDVRVDAAALLQSQRIGVDRHVVYRADAVQELAAPLVAALQRKEITAVALYSPRSARLVSERLREVQLGPAAATIDAYCLSLAVAETAAPFGWQSLHACHSPTNAAMHELILSHAKNPV